MRKRGDKRYEEDYLQSVNCYNVGLHAYPYRMQ